ncbi:MAG: ComEC/Rec2 family competence protein [Sulfuricaulis sp.]|nr:ComEC/Rec2 family competence protein [Sulfuricaulis sp.]
MNRHIPAALWLAYLAFAWTLGVAAAAFTGADRAAALAAAGLLATLSFAFRPRASTLLLAAAGAGLVFLAGWRYDATRPDDTPTGIARYNGQTLRFRALVDAEPQERASWRRYRLAVREAFVDGRWQPDSGGVLMDAPLYPERAYGDVLEIEGELETPPAFADFDYREYLLRRGVTSVISFADVRLLDTGQGSTLRSALISARARLGGALQDALPEPEAALAAGVLLGARSAVPRDLRDDMNATGTSHLIAVSGQNVTIVAGLLIAMLTWAAGRRRAAWLALAAIVAYAGLVGAQPSVLRAAVMGSLYVMSIALGRQRTAPVALLFAAGLMLAGDPRLAHDVSFQLSFAATLGLIVLAPPLQERLQAALPAGARELPATRAVTATFAVTLAAIAFTLPITAVNFHRVSLVAPLTNLFAVPAFAAVAATAALTAGAGLVFPAAGDLTAWLSWPPAAYMIAVVRLFAALPAASIELRGAGAGHAIAYYAVLALAVWWFGRHPAPRPEPTPAPIQAPVGARPALVPAAGVAVLCGLCAVLLWLVITAPAADRLSVTFLDVGQGEAILIEGPAGHRILVDGGPGGEAINAALGRHLPFYDRRLDLVVLTHPQADHLGGLPEVLDAYTVRGVLANPLPAETALYGAWKDALARAQAPVAAARRGQNIDLGEGARLDVLAPSAGGSGSTDVNDASVVLRLSLGEVSFLLTADIGEDAETALLRTGTDLQAQVLKVAHHGSRNSSSPPFLRRVQPLVDVISVGAENRFGHPTQDVLDRLYGDLVLRTDQNGDITVSTDGDRIWVRPQR